jgi:hypothetical protein
MPEPLQPLTIEERLTTLEREVAILKMQIEQMVNPKTCSVEQFGGAMKDMPPEAWEGVGPPLGGSAAHLPPEVWAEFQKCCEEVRRAADSEP